MERSMLVSSTLTLKFASISQKATSSSDELDKDLHLNEGIELISKKQVAGVGRHAWLGDGGSLYCCSLG